MKTTTLLTALALTAFGLSGTAYADAHEGESAKGESECIDFNRVKTSRAQDSSTVIVTMNDNEQYKITTTTRCSGMNKRSAIGFDTRSTRRLCKVDSIRISTTNSAAGGVITCPIAHIEKLPDDNV